MVLKRSAKRLLDPYVAAVEAIASAPPEERRAFKQFERMVDHFKLALVVAATQSILRKTRWAIEETTRATEQMAETAAQMAATLEQMRADAIADAAEVAHRESIMLRWTIAGVAFAALAFVAGVLALVTGTS